ncbi:TIGR04211 family SH3 domain-containing protein [Aliikangiella maris]|uniref:TIGR04211 family SH3 domain-containing protein n=2 Tax=Aliikangiella maris TaxID=3162458 RepID=A0ABV3MLH4_9GAMM
MKKKLNFFLILIVSFISLGAPVYAEVGYVDDQTKIWTRTGPSNDYKVRFKLSPGTKFEILERNEETGYVHIKDEEGRTSWLDSQYITETPTAGVLLAEARRNLSNIKQNHQDRIGALERQINELKPLEKTNRDLQGELAKLQTQFEKVSQEKQTYEGRFNREIFFAGAVVFFGGILFGFILTKLGGKSRHSGWS